MADYLDIVADIKGKLEAIEGIGLVHDYERQSKTLQEFIMLFSREVGAGQKQILGWEITRTSVAEYQAGAVLCPNLMVVKGYMGLSDATGSSKVFQGLVNKVRDAFRKADAADPTAPFLYQNQASNLSPVQVPVINDRMFGAYLCHCAEIHIHVQERIVC
jgi:hypothetical protein